MSLRHRLVIMMLVLMAVAIVAVDVVTSSEVHSFLIGRLDDQIGAAQDQLVKYITTARRADGDTLAPSAWLDTLDPAKTKTPGSSADPGGFSKTSLDGRVAPDDFVELLDSNGVSVYEHKIGPPDALLPAPTLPRAVLRGESAPSGNPADNPAFDVGSTGARRTEYRVEIAQVPGGELVIAASTSPIQSTISSLRHIEILVSALVMLVLAALVAWVVRLGLRPLEDMTETADAFAKGDLSRRIRFSDESTEVGRLGRALNGMLVQIDSAFSLSKESEARLRRFVADASHDLRTPLTSIRGYAELLRKGAFSHESDRRRALGRIEHEAERMSVLVDDLLLLARLDQGRPIAHEPVEIRPLVADAVDAVRAVQPTRQISLDSPHGVLVHGDPGRIRQAVDNLLRNAAVHTPLDSAVEVKVVTEGPTMQLSVADDGPGLSADEVEHVFDRFFQADLSRTGQGTGLGLSIVAAIAEAHGGRAWVESTPGIGSTFYFALPIDREPTGLSPDQGSAQELDSTAATGGEHAWFGADR